MKKNISTKGFNLVELMVVVAIIGILSSVAVPRFATFQAAAKQTEGKQGLNALFLAMQAYQVNYNEFPTAAKGTAPGTDIGFSMSGNKPRYTYTTHSTTDGWAGGAVSVDKINAQTYDHQRINTNKWLCAPYNSVTLTKASTIAGTDKKIGGTAKECPEQVDQTAESASNARTWQATYTAASDSQ